MKLRTFSIAHPELGARKVRETHREIAIARFLLGCGIKPGTPEWKAAEDKLSITTS